MKLKEKCFGVIGYIEYLDSTKYNLTIVLHC